MKWIKCKERLPHKSGDYLVRYIYQDKGSERGGGMRCYYNIYLKSFDIETRSIPQCQVIEWATVDAE